MGASLVEAIDGLCVPPQKLQGLTLLAPGGRLCSVAEVPNPELLGVLPITADVSLHQLWWSCFDLKPPSFQAASSKGLSQASSALA